MNAVDITWTRESITAASAVYGGQIPDSGIRSILDNALDHAEITVGNGFPTLPGASMAVNDEHAYRIDAARSLMTAARELQDTAQRIASIAGKLGDLEYAGDGYFPAAGAVRDALRAYRTNDVILRVDSALGSAMLADRERGLAAREG